MNYDEIIAFIMAQTYHHIDIVNTFDKAIETPKGYQQAAFLSTTISLFQETSLSYQSDINFMRAAIEYIDGLNENQDNGDES